MSKKSTVEKLPIGAREKFFRIVMRPLGPGEQFVGYQGEVIEIEGDRVISRQFIENPETKDIYPPNLFEYAQSRMMDAMDPRNTFVAPEY